MLDDLMVSLSEVSSKLLPIAGLVCLIILIVILVHVLRIVKNMPTTVSKVDGVLDATQKSVEKLDEPLDVLRNVSGTVDKVNDTAVGFVNKVVDMSLQHTEAFMSKMADKRTQKEQYEATNEAIRKENEGEDFGVYEK